MPELNEDNSPSQFQLHFSFFIYTAHNKDTLKEA